MAGVMIGVDPHKASRTAVAISGAEEPLGELRVRANAVQAERLLAWAAAWPLTVRAELADLGGLQRAWHVLFCRGSHGAGPGRLS